MLAAELANVTFSFTTHGPAIFFEPNRWRIDEKIRRASFVSCISHFCRSQVMIWAPLEKWQHLHIVHCGVSPDLFEPVTPRPDGRTLMHVGRLDLVKGLPVLLNAVQKIQQLIPDVKLKIVADGSQRQPLEEYSRELGIADNVEFLGFKSQAEVRDALQSTDVYVMSSFAEGVPVALMEPMAAGLPVVSTRIAGIAELIDDGVSGYLVPPGDADSLTVRIAQLLSDPELRATFGKAGRETVRAEFDIDKEANWLCKVLTSTQVGEQVGIRPSREREEPSATVSDRDDSRSKTTSSAAPALTAGR